MRYIKQSTQVVCLYIISDRALPNVQYFFLLKLSCVSSHFITSSFFLFSFLFFFFFFFGAIRA
jgi:hypothetical protein